jgi:hypothetical protein
MRADNVRELSDRVVAMDFDAAVVEPPRHRSFHSVNEGADVAHSPSCRARLPSRRGPTDVVGSGAKEEPQCLIVLDGPQQSAESVRSGGSRTRSNGRRYQRSAQRARRIVFGSDGGNRVAENIADRRSELASGLVSAARLHNCRPPPSESLIFCAGRARFIASW